MKKKRVIALVLLALTVMFWKCCCDPEIIGSVPNTLRPQETANWCWAAVTQMLAEHVGITVKQCDLANHRFGRTDCCNNQNIGSNCPKTDSCNTPGWPMLTYAGVSYSESGTALTWDQIRDEIYCDEDPMGYAYGTSGVVGHVVVIKGYVTAGGTDWVVLNDPWAPCVGSERLISYDQYKDPAGTATHWNTWYNISD